MNPAGRSALREGIVAGLIGAAVVAIWFFVFDILRGRPFLTPSLLGSLVFLGVNTPTVTAPAVGPILGYTILHGLAFVAFGVVAATMLAMSDREPALFVYRQVMDGRAQTGRLERFSDARSAGFADCRREPRVNLGNSESLIKGDDAKRKREELRTDRRRSGGEHPRAGRRLCCTAHSRRSIFRPRPILPR
jgi:hypothetical protein